MGSRERRGGRAGVQRATGERRRAFRRFFQPHVVQYLVRECSTVRATFLKSNSRYNRRSSSRARGNQREHSGDPLFPFWLMYCNYIRKSGNCHKYLLPTHCGGKIKEKERKRKWVGGNWGFPDNYSLSSTPGKNSWLRNSQANTPQHIIVIDLCCSYSYPWT